MLLFFSLSPFIFPAVKSLSSSLLDSSFTPFSFLLDFFSFFFFLYLSFIFILYHSFFPSIFFLLCSLRVSFFLFARFNHSSSAIFIEVEVIFTSLCLSFFFFKFLSSFLVSTVNYLFPFFSNFVFLSPYLFLFIYFYFFPIFSSSHFIHFHYVFKPMPNERNPTKERNCMAIILCQHCYNNNRAVGLFRFHFEPENSHSKTEIKHYRIRQRQEGLSPLHSTEADHPRLLPDCLRCLNSSFCPDSKDPRPFIHTCSPRLPRAALYTIEQILRSEEGYSSLSATSSE